MSNILIHHIKKFCPISISCETSIGQYFNKKTYNKKEFLVQENSNCKYHYFVIKGCLRMFYLNEKGIEQTIQFAIENWWITDYIAFENEMKTEFSIQAIELTEVYEIDYKTQEKLLHQFPELERYFKLIFQKAYAASLLRTKYLFDFSREDFYHHFNSNFPNFTNRIPQHILASYLNMTPEYLSEIKKKARS